MRVTVTLKPGGGSFNRRERGQMVSYTSESQPFEVSQHVYETFRDRFVVVGGEPPKPAKQPTGQAPNTDDDPNALRQDAGGNDDSDGDDNDEGGGEENATIEEVTALVDGLKGVGLTVELATALTWTAPERDRVQAVIDRGGKRPLPKFLDTVATEIPKG